MEENDQIRHLKTIDWVHVRAKVVEVYQVDCCVTAGGNSLPVKGNVTRRTLTWRAPERQELEVISSRSSDDLRICRLFICST